MKEHHDDRHDYDEHRHEDHQNTRRPQGERQESRRRLRSRSQNAFPHALVHFGTTALTPPPLDWLRFKMLEANKAIYHWTMWILQ